MSKLELTEIPIDKQAEDDAELVMLDPEVLEEIDPKQLQYQVTVLDEKLAQSKPNLAVVHEYRKKVCRQPLSISDISNPWCKVTSIIMASLFKSVLTR